MVDYTVTFDYITSMKSLLVVILLLVAGWFYWFQYRPAQIRASCGKIRTENYNKFLDNTSLRTREWKEYEENLINNLYENCLNNKGISR